MRRQRSKGVIFFEEKKLPGLRRIGRHSKSDKSGRLKYLLPKYLRESQILTLDTNFADPISSFEVVKETLNEFTSWNKTLRMYVLKSEYGALKSLYEVAREGGLITHNLILKELEDKRKLLGQETSSLECKLLNNLGIEACEEIGYVQDINNLYGNIVSKLRSKTQDFDSEIDLSETYARNVKRSARRMGLNFGYTIQNRVKSISTPDVALFDLSRRTQATILSADGDLCYLSALTRSKVPICDCIEDVRFNLDGSGERFQSIFGRFELMG